MLPQNVPSSLHFKEKHKREEPKAKVKYYVKAKLDTYDEHDEMKYKQVLIIREPAVAYKEGEEQKERSEIKTWCCIDQGASTMWSTFNKNIFTPHEVAHATVHVDNSECQLKVTEVSLFVEQKMTIHHHHHSHTVTSKLVE